MIGKTHSIFNLSCITVKRSSSPSLVWHDKKQKQATSLSCTSMARMLCFCLVEMRSLLLSTRMHCCLSDVCSRILLKCPRRKTDTSRSSEGSCVKSTTARVRSACSTLRTPADGYFLNLFPEPVQHLMTSDLTETTLNKRCVATPSSCLSLDT